MLLAPLEHIGHHYPAAHELCYLNPVSISFLLCVWWVWFCWVLIIPPKKIDPYPGYSALTRQSKQTNDLISKDIKSQGTESLSIPTFGNQVFLLGLTC